MSTLQYEGKAKRLYATADPLILRQEFKDDLTAFDAVKKGSFSGKGALNASISTALFERLEAEGIRTHFVRRLDDTSMEVRALSMLPLEVVVRNMAAGSLVKRLGRTEGEVFVPAILEFYLKNDALHDPILNSDHILRFGLATSAQLSTLRVLALSINEHLRSWFGDAGLTLVDFKLEFGVDPEGQIILGDEISPDTCRLWDTATGEKLDKDRFRFDLGDVATGYGRIARQLGVLPGVEGQST